MEQCKYFVVRKKRFCKMTVKEGEEYCGEHQKIVPAAPVGDSSENGAKLRIACPLDTKHTCYAHNLEKHLKICNARPVPAEPFISKGINYCPSGSDADGIVVKPLAEFSQEQVQMTITKVNNIYNKFITYSISEKILTHELLEAEMSKCKEGHEYGNKTLKHLKQVSSMLGLLNEYKLMKSDTCYVDFGAGRGQLSFWICKAMEADEKSKILLIERASPKHKRDNKLKTSEKVKRIRADISDLVLDNLLSQANNVVGVAKHLCGEATDLALSCLTSTVKNKNKIKGGIITFCCHHRCRWVPYVGKDFFQSNGLDSVDFNIMCGMASWATCGTGFSREKNLKIKELEDSLLQNKRDTTLDLSRQEKVNIGTQCKSIINWGRLNYLQKIGFKCKLHYYVSENITPENVCIVMYT